MIAHVEVVPSASEWPSTLIFTMLLIAVAWVYNRGLDRLPGMSNRRSHAIGMGAALTVLLVVFIPPVEEAADACFTIHMVQHLILIVLIPVLLVYAKAGRCLMMGLPWKGRRALSRIRHAARSVGRMTTVIFAGVLFAVVLWGWHLTVMYDAAVRNEPIHNLEHTTFLVAGLLLWMVVMDERYGFLPRGILVFGTAFQSGLLGAALVFAPVPLYQSHLQQSLLPLSPLGDQQLAGGIMWMPLGGVFLLTLYFMVTKVLADTHGELPIDA